MISKIEIKDYKNIKAPKQLFIATQNPSCLDALNIDDDLQRLFIVSKSTKGMFRCKRWTKNLVDSVYDSLNRTLIEDRLYTKQEILALVSNSKEYLRLSTGYRYGILGGLSKFY